MSCTSTSSNMPVISGAPTPGPRASSSAAAPALNQSVSFTVSVPPQATLAAIARKAAAPRKHRAVSTTPYISANIASISIQLLDVNGNALAYPPPAPSVTNIVCSTPATGCSVRTGNVVAAIGTNRYLVTTYTLPGGASTPNNVTISSGLVDVVVNGDGTVNTVLGNPADLAVGGYVASLALSVSQTPNSLVFGAPGSGTILVVAKDVAGATIVGNALFANPVTVSATGIALTGPGLDADGTYTLTQPESASNLIGYTYDGASSSIAVGAATTSQSGATIAAPEVTIAPIAATPSPVASASPTSTASPSASPTVAPSGMPSTGPPTPTPPPTATPVASATPKPSATPVSTPKPTASPTQKPTASPAPSASPTATAAAGLSLYVLSAGNDTISEFPLTTSGVPTATPKRTIGGTGFGCPSSLTRASDSGEGGVNDSDYGFGVTGLTVNAANATVYAGASGDTCKPHGPNMLYAISPAATGTSGIGTNTIPTAMGAQGSGADFGLLYDPSASALDFYAGIGGTSTLASNSFSYAFLQIEYSGTSGGTATVTNAVGVDPTMGTPCLNSSGFGVTQTGCVSSADNGVSGPFFQPGYDAANATTYSANGAPLAIDGNGTVYQAAIDQESFPSLPGISSGLVSLANSANADGAANKTKTGDTGSTWVEGLDTLLDPFNAVAAMTYDPTTSRLYVLENGNKTLGTFWQGVGAASGANQRPDLCQRNATSGAASSCSDGAVHYYIVAFNVNGTSLSNTDCTNGGTNVCDYPPGALDIQPVLVISGDALHLPPAIDVKNNYTFPSNLVPQSGFTAANGKLYLANILGSTCSAACVSSESSGLSATSGEIDVYDGTATGYFDDTSPGSVLLGAFTNANIGVPVGVAVGPAGSATMSSASIAAVRSKGVRFENLPPVHTHLRRHRQAVRR